MALRACNAGEEIFRPLPLVQLTGAAAQSTIGALLRPGGEIALDLEFTASAVCTRNAGSVEAYLPSMTEITCFPV